MQLPAKITLVTFDKYEFSKRHILSPPRIHNKCAEPLFKRFAVRVEECHSAITTPVVFRVSPDEVALRVERISLPGENVECEFDILESSNGKRKMRYLPSRVLIRDTSSTSRDDKIHHPRQRQDIT